MASIELLEKFDTLYKQYEVIKRQLDDCVKLVEQSIKNGDEIPTRVREYKERMEPQRRSSKLAKFSSRVSISKVDSLSKSTADVTADASFPSTSKLNSPLSTNTSASKPSIVNISSQPSIPGVTHQDNDDAAIAKGVESKRMSSDADKNDESDESSDIEVLYIPPQDQTAQTTPKRPSDFSLTLELLHKIKTRFCSQPEKYRQYVDVMQLFQKQHTAAITETDPPGTGRPQRITVKEVYERVEKIFENHPDLFEEFGKWTGVYSPTTGMQHLKLDKRKTNSNMPCKSRSRKRLVSPNSSNSGVIKRPRGRRELTNVPPLITITDDEDDFQ